MSKTIWYYKLSAQEYRLWTREDMQGWCRAFQGWVEDEARENGLVKYVIYDINGDVLVKDKVSPLPQMRPADRWRGPAAT
jgi:hypothetical protein